MNRPNVIVGVDTHSDTHYVAVIDEHGKQLTAEELLAVGSGYRKILAFITHFGLVTGVGVEGTGSYGGGTESSSADSRTPRPRGQPTQPSSAAPTRKIGSFGRLPSSRISPGGTRHIDAEDQGRPRRMPPRPPRPPRRSPLAARSSQLAAQR